MAREAYFSEESMLRAVHRESAVALSGPRALLMQAAHPVAFAGFFAHTGALDEPYQRLSRTAAVMDTIAFGSRAEADRATRRVRAMHRRVRGVLPKRAGRFAGRHALRRRRPRAAAVDPRLPGRLGAGGLRALRADRCPARSARPTGRTTGWWAGCSACASATAPAHIEGFEDYMAGMLAGGDLHVSAEARRLAVQIVMRPPIPLRLRPVLEVANFVTVGLLPAGLRREYGFGWDPARALALAGGAEYTRRVIVPLLPARLRLVSRARAAA